MFLILLMAVVSIVSIGFQVKDYIEQKRTINAAQAKHKYDSVIQSKVHVVLYVVIVLLSIVALIIGLSSKDTTTIALGVILMGIGITEVLTINTNIRFYYNDDSIITNGKVIRYRSIKSIERRRLAIGSMYDLTTLQNQTYKINQKAVDIIQEHSNVKIK